HFAIWFFAFAMSFGNCVAQPAINAQVVLQICQAFSKKSPEQMPAIVLPEAGKAFVEIYGRFSELLEGCLSAIETSRNSNGMTFFLENTRFDSYWHFSTDETLITKINIDRYRPVTLADDANWQSPFAVQAQATPLAAAALGPPLDHPEI